MDRLCGLTLGPAVTAPKMVREADDRLPAELPCICAPDGERYYAGGILGQGAYGVVLRYDSTREGRPLAVKVIHGRTARDQEDRACEVPECRGVVPEVRLDANEHWGAWTSGDARSSPRWSPRAPSSWAFYAMPCLAPLGEATDHHVARAAQVVGAMARALARLSRCGFRYHDLKPGNMLRDGDGRLLLADLASVATRASTYPPPMCLQHQFPWYRHESGFVRGPRSECYALNTAWALIVSFVIVAMPGRSVRVGGRDRSVSRILSYQCPAVAGTDHGDWAVAAVRRLLERIGAQPGGDAATVLSVLLDQIQRGTLPELSGTLKTVSQLG